ncbi:MAG TPA: type II secretion system protein [Candidatus Paceibacterota bacterium]
MTKKQKGFTLIELLVVIAIVAVLSVVVILTLNPAELLKQARDSNRVSDLATLKSAISLYQADGQTEWSPAVTTCYMTTSTGGSRCGNYFGTVFAVTSTGSGTVTANNGTGWIPVNFTKISSGAPFGQLPLDPVNNSAYFYGFAATSTTGNPSMGFKLGANMESTKYANGGSGDVETTDGGTVTTVYETGALLSL